jgi:hypothetical protein
VVDMMAKPTPRTAKTSKPSKRAAAPENQASLF